MTDGFWCELCNERPQVGHSADGVAACEECMMAVLDGVAETQGAVLIGPNRAQRRAMERGFKRRKGYTRR